MAKIKSRRCDHPDGCMIQPSYGQPGSKAATRCSAHKEPGMVDLRNKHCDHPGCTTSPSFALPGSKGATRCSAHKEPGMVDVKHKRR